MARIVVPDKNDRHLKRISSQLNKAGHSVRLVGGSVRDLLSGIEPKDYDLATTAPPEVVLTTFSNEYAGFHSIGTGLKHGTVAVVVDHVPYEVTTLRVDKDTDGRHAEVEFTTDWEADAARRDFTMNALYMDVDTSQIYDYFGGQRDLARKVIRFVGSPDDRVKEDYLRILRLFRFFSRDVDAVMEPRSLIERVVADNAEGLGGISGERIWSEVTRIVAGPNAEAAMSLMFKTRVTDAIGLPYSPDSALYLGLGNVSSGWIPNMAALLGTVENLDKVRQRWKFDNASHSYLSYVISNRKVRTSPEWAEAEMSRGVDPMHIYHLANYCGDFETASHVKSVQVPKFPINGEDVKATGRTGPAIGEALKRAREAWISSRYTMTRDQLLESLRTTS